MRTSWLITPLVAGPLAGAVLVLVFLLNEPVDPDTDVRAYRLLVLLAGASLGLLPIAGVAVKLSAGRPQWLLAVALVLALPIALMGVGVLWAALRLWG